MEEFASKLFNNEKKIDICRIWIKIKFKFIKLDEISEKKNTFKTLNWKKKSEKDKNLT